MPRENSFSDSDGRSLTPDLDEEEQAAGGAAPRSPTYASPVAEDKTHVYPPPKIQTAAPATATVQSPQSAVPRSAAALHVQSPHHHHHHLTPRDRFRAAARKVMALHRTSTVIANRGVGAEPGVDVRRSSAELQYGGIKQDCIIQIFDYSAVRQSFGQMTNKQFVDLMGNPAASEREPWVKVRWINIGGKSWDVIRAMSLRYDLHPLALEDVFHAPSHTRSKADYYSKHLFLRILCHELADEEGTSILPEAIPRSTSPTPMDDEKTIYDSTPSTRQSTMRFRKNRRGASEADAESRISPHGTLLANFENEISADNRKKREAEEAALRLLKDGRVNVKVSPMYIFLLRDGTVISMRDTPDVEMTRPIAARLGQRDTVLRTSADPSLLVQSLLDLIVDKALEVVDEYHFRIMKLERNILLKPSVKAVTALHVLDGDLILHKRTLEPIKTVVYGLRRYDLDRCAALVDTSLPENKDVKVVGYMSHKSKIYLADVHDHMEYILTSLDMFAGIGENLIDYTFNMKSYEMNEVMRRLTLATIIFLPLTLLTGYFGMNFDPMWSVQQNSDVLFWIIALPVMAIVIPLFLWNDIRGGMHYVQKKVLAKNAIKSVKQS